MTVLLIYVLNISGFAPKLLGKNYKKSVSSIYMNDHTLGFHPETQKPEPPCTALLRKLDIFCHGVYTCILKSKFCREDML